ncbi:uncharacterized protein HMPREF1541_07823 [Cyphellophora europaea CBS 101466]|uniref:Succinylglutamate desuccinylase/Aspartoacylase catalytic domain-containing protein n=1 Tax=Cyphellophora europaea (strain CBS 101466) TaxID=1220924 RepID=W2RK37_CYPE1|nr:uncharacterized protein HMPREF1541_07823 [Cyphellophora europaea CBS 101466]ETN36836.1 hypothetical protein HMPREF1541_07823 [Cyphellophora europaea CBS 101466]
MRPSTLLSTATLAAVTAAQSLTNDTYLGYPVLDVSASSPLDLASIPANTISRYWLRPGISQGNIPYFLPVIIARGTSDSLDTGRKLSLSASIHGDELNGVPVVQRVFQTLVASEVVANGEFNGTIIGVPQLNPQGNFMNARNFYTPGSSGFLTNLNRIMPGEAEPEEASLTDAYAGQIWYGLWGNTSNVDVAVDFHCLATGADGPLWAYADFDFPYVQRLAELAMPDVIKIDPGEPGSVETTWVDYGVPAITLEIGPAKQWNGDLIDRAEEFVYRLLEDLGMMSAESLVEGDFDSEASYKGTNFSSVYVTQSGWVNVTVGVLDDVEEGQEVGTLYNWFGDVVETLTASVSGRVLQVQTDPAVDAGRGVVDIVYNATASGEESNSRKMKVRRGIGGRGRAF